MRVANAFSATIIICLSLSAAKAQETTPQLTLDTGGHMSLVKGMAFTADGTQLVSAGYDKTIRIWDVASQRTVRTIRGQTTRGEEGRIYALALSPDNRWLAVAGWMAPGRGVRDADVGDIRLYEFATGELAGLLRGHRDVVNALEFSPDSKRLFSGGGFGDKSAILWDAEKRTPIHRFVGHTAELYAVAGESDGI